MVHPLIELWKNKVISRETQAAPARRAGVENRGIEKGVLIGCNYSFPWGSGRGEFAAGPFGWPGFQILRLPHGDSKAGAAGNDLPGGSFSCRTAPVM